jgi:hypothetical protein
MDKLIDWFTSLPKFVQILFVVVVFSLLAYGVYISLVGKKGPKTDTENKGNVVLSVQDATTSDDNSNSHSAAYDDASGLASTRDYWNNLSTSSANDNGGVLPENGKGNVSSQREYLDPFVYSEIERYYIQNGTCTKEEIDAKHARERAAAEQVSTPRLSSSTSVPLTRDQQDSIYFARMEKAYGIASKYADNGSAPSPREEPKKEPRHLDIRQNDSPVESENSFQNDGIINSLGSPSSKSVRSYKNGKVEINPAKATFMKTERVLAGQRVIMRLMEDLRLSDGTVIPANTHVSGICSIGNRLDIRVTSVQYEGKMFHFDLSVYDNDGTEGIYCPVVEKKSRVGAAVGSEVASNLASTATSLFTRNAIAGRAASSSVRELSQVSMKDGSVAINVVAGYEFYLFENVKNN